jgi:hypothetical protein
MSEKKPKVGTIGIVIGSVALLLALFHFYAGPLSPQPKLEHTIAAKAVALRDATIAALKGNEIKKKFWPSKWDVDKLIDVITALFGGLAIISGIFAFIRKEPLRVTIGATVLGGGAIAFQFVALA